MRIVLFVSMSLILLLVSCSPPAGVYPIKEDESDELDFSYLDEVINDRDIVFIGESTHGSKTFTDVKVELVKYLFEHHGFSVLALESGKVESDFFNIEGHSLDDHFAMEGMIYEAWQSSSMESLLSFIREDPKRSVHGIDPWPVLNGRRVGESAFHSYMRDKVEATSENHLDRAFIETEGRFIYFMQGLMMNKASMGDQNEADLILDSYKDLLIKGTFLDKGVRRLIEGRIDVLEHYFHNDFLTDEYQQTPHQAYYSRRDLGMFLELKELYEENKEEKIIVWAHNGHIQKNVERIEMIDESLVQDFEPPPLVLGTLAAEEWGEEAYFMGLYFNQRAIAFFDGNTYDVEPKENEEMEYVLSDYGYEVAFIDFNETNEEWPRERIKAYSDGFFDFRMIPSEQYDGVLFFETVEPRY
ncbi:erythromycin esterase family protein [Alteribacter aurantiacus]|uniref:erythromycin esterase family protein n=1 Tax=Alteribacter aurantiacus TaxID=254410 RepID=UPI000479F966|nr:erythromycin esterase family protein [Alteribacter aurantiacus]